MLKAVPATSYTAELERLYEKAKLQMHLERKEADDTAEKKDLVGDRQHRVAAVVSAGGSALMRALHRDFAQAYGGVLCLLDGILLSLRKQRSPRYVPLCFPFFSKAHEAKLATTPFF